MAIEYGMTSEQFWKDDPDLFVSYRTSFINKEKRKLEYDNYNSWLQGLYIYTGFNTVYSRAWSKNSKAEYPKKPIEFGQNNKKEDKIDNESQYKNQLLFYSTMKQRYEQKIFNDK